MTPIKFILKNIDDWQQVVVYLHSILNETKLVAIYGEMGAGKTTFVGKFIEYISPQEKTSSPTFSIVNEYNTTQGKVFHFDFYRFQSEQEALDIGIYEYWDSGHICLMEWPQHVETLLNKEDFIKMYIKVEEGQRIVTFTLHKV